MGSDVTLSWTRQALAVVLAGAMVAGSLVLFLGIPVLWLWLMAQATSDYLTIYGVSLIGAPATMAVWGWALHRLNRVYLAVLGAPAAARKRQTAWLKSIGAERRRRDPSALLDVSMTASVVVALIAFVVWCVFLGALGNGAGPGAW